ncbi:MAG: neutral/alkaline non-lysosomal ceramidase N-terminal domain-containing protein [Acidobacteriales bacterium]|nr:neutral/alkaline non-lysosomal ceramidase N-terminal domain-containing protein [Terriglobales bacterium]
MRTLRLGLLLCLAAVVALAASPGFRAAAAKVDITPDSPQWLLGYQARQSLGVHDHIHHRVVALDDGNTQVYLVSSEFAVFAPSFFDEFGRELKQRTRIEPSQVWWTVTHTHSAPELGPGGIGRLFLGERYKHDYDHAYAKEVKDKLIAAIREAREKLFPARVYIGTGRAEANINRRERRPNGRIVLGKNPEGPVDRMIGLIRIERLDGGLVALIANYAMHGTVLGGKNLLISGDAPGVVASYVEAKLGAPMLYINGAEGNVAPLNSVEPDFRHLDDYKKLLGDPILNANAALRKPTRRIRLKAEEIVVETPRKPGLGWTDELADYLKVNGDGTADVRVPVRLLRIDKDTAIWGAPVEMFSEIALNMRVKSPFRHTFYFGLTNGCLGYLPTKQAFADGGYEPGVCVFTDRVEADLTKEVSEALADLKH